VRVDRRAFPRGRSRRAGPVFRAGDQTGPRRAKVNVFGIFLDGAQGAVEEPGLPEFAAGAPATWRFLEGGSRKGAKHARVAKKRK
jgi:hypothetical protein